ncbi:MAG: AAA family ATPase [Bacteroidales bacterium]|nr:AAA family ATPase [Bacteroidales bacterium]
MEQLFDEHRILLDNTDLGFKRYLHDQLPWTARLMGIQGFRGVGKTTMILQYIKQTYAYDQTALYVSLDNLYFSDNSLVQLAKEFVANGGEHLFIDEVHKYSNWPVELKNIYDLHKNLKVTFTASSLLEILNSKADLSRRALVFTMQGMSFREYINFTQQSAFTAYALDEILENHQQIASEITQSIKPLKFFKTYLKAGYYPFFNESNDFYRHRLQSLVNMVIEIELPILRDVDKSKIDKMKQLLYIIAHSVPFKPNISKLSERIGISRNTLVEYIKHLADSKLINVLYADAHGISLLQKPDKIFLENPNLSYTLAPGSENLGHIRESFFLNQLSAKHAITYPKQADFLVDEQYYFEVGGKNKTQKQIAGMEQSYLAVDDIEYGFKNKIPLWLFGFLY